MVDVKKNEVLKEFTVRKLLDKESVSYAFNNNYYIY